MCSHTGGRSSQWTTNGDLWDLTDRRGDSSYAYGLNESGGGLLLLFALLLRWARGAVPSWGTFSSPSTWHLSFPLQEIKHDMKSWSWNSFRRLRISLNSFIWCQLATALASHYNRRATDFNWPKILLFWCSYGNTCSWKVMLIVIA